MNNQNVHPIHILYSVVALAIVVWSVLYYQVKNAVPPVIVQEERSPTPEPGLSAEARARVMAEIASATNTPQLSAQERSKISNQIKNEPAQQGLSAEARARMESELTNN